MIGEDVLELAVATHLAILVVATSWAFGGNADWVRVPLALLASIGPLILAYALGQGSLRGGGLKRLTRWLWPFWAFNALVLLSCLTPGMRTVHIEGTDSLVPIYLPLWRPGAALRSVALQRLWIFDGIYLSCFNLLFLVKRRRIIRRLLGVVALNGMALAIFGTVQKLFGATGLYFGRVPTRQPYFFASFVYDNHWGAFALLMVGIALGLAWRFTPDKADRGFLHSPSFAAAVAVVFLAVAIPLSGSRFCSMLLVVLLVVTGIAGGRRILRRMGGAALRAVIGGAAAVALLMAASTWYVAGDVLSARLERTQAQFTAMHASGNYMLRSRLYRDTARMALVRPLFGWGMGSFPTVFMIFNSEEPNAIDHLPIYYHDAHNDWLQAVAENGVVGALLLALCLLIPLGRCRLTRQEVLADPLALCVLLSAGLVLAYALIEFPFGNTAVVLAWWVCAFGIMRYVRLGRQLVGDEPGRQKPV